MTSPASSPLPPSRTPRERAATLDGLGTAVSCACAVHCLALPAAVVLLPTLGLAALLDPRVEWAFFGTTLVLGLASLGPAAWRGRRTPGAARPLALLTAGVALLALGRLGVAEGGGVERGCVAGGAALVIAAHASNRRRARCCAG